MSTMNSVRKHKEEQLALQGFSFLYTIW